MEYILEIIGNEPQSEYPLREIATEEGKTVDRITREEFVSVGEDRKVLAKQKYTRHRTSVQENPWTLVPGYIASKITYNQRGLLVVQCEGVPEEEKPGVTEVLRLARFEGPVNYNS